jgi:hypothetical protein
MRLLGKYRIGKAQEQSRLAYSLQNYRLPQALLLSSISRSTESHTKKKGDAADERLVERKSRTFRTWYTSTSIQF